MNKTAVIGVLVLLLAGCSTKLAYNNLDWLASWYLGDFIELSDPQQQEFDKRLNSLLIWHREVELPSYRDQLRLLQKQLQSPQVNAKQWAQHIKEISGHWLRIRNKASLEMAILAPELSEEQVTDFFAALKEHNQEKREEFDELSKQEAEEKRFDNVVEQFEEAIGSVTQEQEGIIKEYIASSHKTPLVYLAYSNRFQLGLKKTFMEVDKSHLSSQLYELLSHPEQFKLAKTLQLDSNEKFLVANMLQKVHESASKKQLTYFQDEVADLIELIGELMAKPA